MRTRHSCQTVFLKVKQLPLHRVFVVRFSFNHYVLLFVPQCIRNSFNIPNSFTYVATLQQSGENSTNSFLPAADSPCTAAAAAASLYAAHCTLHTLRTADHTLHSGHWTVGRGHCRLDCTPSIWGGIKWKHSLSSILVLVAATY